MTWLWEVVGAMLAGAVMEAVERVFVSAFRAVRWVCRKLAGMVGRAATG